MKGNFKIYDFFIELVEIFNKTPLSMLHKLVEYEFISFANNSCFNSNEDLEYDDIILDFL